MLPTGVPEEDSLALERSRKLRAMLLVAFGGLLALMVAAGLDSLRSLRKLDVVEREVNQRFAAHSQGLSTIIISVHVYHDSMENFLMTDGKAARSASAQDVADSGSLAHAALKNYPGDRDSEEQMLLRSIQQKLSEEENSFTTVSAWRVEQRSSRAPQFLREQILPRHANILEVARDISSLNDRRLTEANVALANSYQGLQTRVVRMVTLALTAGLLLSLAGGFYILRLEKQGRERYLALVHSRHELESLSARLVEVQEAERRTISRELHDEVGQTLGALLVDVGQMGKLVPPDDKIVHGQISRIKSAAESAMKSIRDIALLLRPPMLDDLGLLPALEWQGREVSRRGSMEVEVHAEKVSEELPDDVKVCVYRLVQEALNNASTHAEAKNAKVSVAQTADKISVAVEDDGRGFDPQRKRGMGLLGMEERVRRLGGTISLYSAPGKGTTIRAELPLHHAEHA